MRRVTGWKVLALVALVAVVVWGAVDIGDDDSGATATVSSSDDGSGFVNLSQLPVEARETVVLIDAGGPFASDRDGSIFMNRERLLPAHPRGYWREFTVPTPGESDRGARRLVTGDGGEIYYTDDHYASFRRVERGSG